MALIPLAEFRWMEWRTTEDTFNIFFGGGRWEVDLFLLFDVYGILTVMDRVMLYWQTYSDEILESEIIAMKRYCNERLAGRVLIESRRVRD